MTLAAKDLSYQAQGMTGRLILQKVSLTMEPGSITLIAGRTGSGKSTLLHLLSGLKIPAEGQVYIGDRPLWKKEAPCRQLMKKLGYVFQYPEHQFFLPTVRGELLHSLKPQKLKQAEQERRIREALYLSGMDESFLDRSPFHLSGGEKRKAALASVFAAEPDWLLLDEPSSGLDSDIAAWLAEQLPLLKAKRLRTGGIVIASHDLDLFLPIADSVILMKDGEAMGQWRAEEMAASPERFEAAGIGVPACVQLASLGAMPGGFWSGLQAEDVAACIAQKLRQGQKPELTAAVRSHELPDPGEAITDSSARENPFAKLDPRAKWAVYLLLSIGIFLRPGWLTAGAGLILVMILAAIAGMPSSKWSRALLPMGGFILFSLGISGLELSLSSYPFSLAGTEFDWERGKETADRLLPLLPVMAAGALFAYCTSPLSMKKGLEALLQRIPGFGKGAETTALAASLMFRFMALIPAEIERFATLASVRGRRGGKPGKLRFRQLPAFFTPLLLSMMQHAEDLSVAMEARGCGKSGIKRTDAAPLRFRRRDGAACLAGLCMGLALMVIGWYFG